MGNLKGRVVDMANVINYTRFLEGAGFNRETSEACVKVVSKMIDDNKFVTKEDLEILELKMDKKMAGFTLATITTSTTALAYFFTQLLNR